MNGALLGAATAAAMVLGVAGCMPSPPPRAVIGRPSTRRSWSIAADAGRLLAAPLLRSRVTARRDAQLPELLERIASGLRSGLALGSSLVAAAVGTPSPLADDLAPVTQALQHGVSVGSGLQAWASAPGASEDVRFVAVALGLGADAGGATARAVDRAAATLRERRELQAEVRALATQARASAAVLAVAPLLFTALVATIEPGAVAFLVTTPLGLACLVLGVALEALSATWMARIVRSAW